MAQIYEEDHSVAAPEHDRFLLKQDSGDQCTVEKVEYTGDKTAFDTSLGFHSDYTRSVQMLIGDDEVPFNLLPDTGIDQVIVLKQGCAGCYSIGDRHKFTNQCESPQPDSIITSEINWFYRMHAYETNVTGRHFHEKVCMNYNDNFDKCANMHIFGSEKNAPRSLFLKGNGFLGLGVKATQVGDDSLRMSALDQLYDNGIIENRMFGIKTELKNRTDVRSVIRFGGYDETAFDESHEILNINTAAPDSWELDLAQIDFHGDDLLGKPTKALINPAMPLIAAPVDDFVKLKDTLKAAHPD